MCKFVYVYRLFVIIVACGMRKRNGANNWAWVRRLSGINTDISISNVCAVVVNGSVSAKANGFERTEKRRAKRSTDV